MNKQRMLYLMKAIRRFETEIGEAVVRGVIKTPCHLYVGQEAVAVGVCAAIKKSDVVYSTHRAHGHYIAKGGNIIKLRDEIYGKLTGCMKGKGGSMHLKDAKVGFILSSAIVANSIPLAVGAALSFKLQKKDNIAIAFLGDGATNEGVFWESLNLACLHKLPVLFVLENNYYATHMPIKKHSANTDITHKVTSFGMKTYRVQGNYVKDVYNITKEAINDIRKGFGPAFIEAMTYRWCGHVGLKDNIDMGIRDKEELKIWKNTDPIKVFKNEIC